MFKRQGEITSPERTEMNTCRFCKNQHNDLVQYARRHYACWSCYLDAGKTLAALSVTEIRRIPWKIARDRNLGELVDHILARHDRRMNEYRASVANKESAA